MDNISKLIEKFSQFPGVGGRQAKRFVYFLLSQDKNYAQELSSAILQLSGNVAKCAHCFRFFLSSGANASVCNICESSNTDKTLLMIIAKDVDLENMQKSNTYNGRYFILNGLMSIANKKDSVGLRTTELVKEIKRGIEEDNLQEIIFAFTVNPEGDNTKMFIKQLLQPLIEKHKIKITTLGRGLSTGTELEYSDSNTLKNALRNRG